MVQVVGFQFFNNSESLGEFFLAVMVFTRLSDVILRNGCYREVALGVFSSLYEPVEKVFDVLGAVGNAVVNNPVTNMYRSWREKARARAEEKAGTAGLSTDEKVELANELRSDLAEAYRERDGFLDRIKATMLEHGGVTGFDNADRYIKKYSDKLDRIRGDENEEV